ncbi:MAG: DUF1499 domain-containing protein [Smithellaceae bacterium]|nr:DUF1499 domain-containing protein [Smithellaceae bacterium]
MGGVQSYIMPIKRYLFIPILLLSLATVQCSQDRPPNVGIKDGKLKACPIYPNCVSSQSSDSRHYVTPLYYSGPLSVARGQVIFALGSMERCRIVVITNNYIRAEFTSPFLKLADDMEFFFDDSEKTIHVRAASRHGYYDLGANRKRVAQLRYLFDELRYERLRALKKIAPIKSTSDAASR